MGRNFVLTAQQIAQAAQMYHEKGLSRRELAAEFGVSEGAMGNALALAGVRLRDKRRATLILLVRRAAVKPPHHEVGRWNWMNPANADRWKTTRPEAF